ncbi:MAG: Nif3-like dinuclear metal center hexameric protein [bacterium]|nr:Nif3-like dinuclear metal center hexameric protein [bacterium]
MTKTVGDIAAQLESAFRLTKAADWDPVGLQLGDPGATAKRVAVCHEVTPIVADQLVGEAVDLAVVYHPLLFRPTTRLVAGSSPAGRAFRLIANGVAVVVVHTAFDMAQGGTADSLAAALGVGETTGFGPAWAEDAVKIVTFTPAEAVETLTAAMAAAGAGRIGAYSGCSFRTSGVGAFDPDETATPAIGSVGESNRIPETRVEMVAPSRCVGAVVAALVRTHPYEEPAYDVYEAKSNAGFIGRVGVLAEPTDASTFADLVRDRLGGVVRVAGDSSVRTVAVVPGSGGSFVGSVAADAIVTGDINHHQARDAVARGMAVIDPGHAATERPGVKALYSAVADLVGATIDMTDVDSDPWKER